MPCVLVADDSRDFAQMLGASLEEAGLDVVTAYSGPAAVAAMREHEIAAAVLDVLMPGISGDAVAERLRQLDPALPILLMTGDAGDPFVSATELPVLRKPFRHEQLVAAVRRLLAPSRQQSHHGRLRRAADYPPTSCPFESRSRTTSRS